MNQFESYPYHAAQYGHLNPRYVRASTYNRLTNYLAPTLFAAAAALLLITGVEYLKSSQESGSRRSTLSQVESRLTSGFAKAVTLTQNAFGIGSANVKPAQLSRIATIRHRGEAYQILGIQQGTALTERRVLVRSMQSQEVKAFAAGERIFGGALIHQIGPDSVEITVDKPEKRLIQLASPRSVTARR